MKIHRTGRRFSSTSGARSSRVGYGGLLGTRKVLIYADYFTKILEDNLKAVVKPQYVDQIPKAVKGTDRTVGALIKARVQVDNYDEIMEVLGTFHVDGMRKMSIEIG